MSHEARLAFWCMIAAAVGAGICALAISCVVWIAT